MTRHHNRTIRAAISCMTVAATVLTGVAGTGLASADSVPAPQWQPCAENAEVECATLPVPIDWSKPRNGTIEVAVARRAATNPDERIGSLVLMPGGPGGSGVDSLLGGVPVSPDLAARFDLVSFDPRGTNRSHPVVCDADLVNNPPNVIPETGGTLAGVRAYSEQLGASCRQHTGPLIDHVDSISTARDIDALRAALGEGTISLYGVSYGTLAGAMYAETFPSRVRALVLDSVFDHSLSARRFLETEARTGEDSFTEFANWCARDARCALHGRDVGQVFDALYAKAVNGQLHRPGDPTTPISPMELVSATIGFFYGPRWTEAADLLKELEDQQQGSAARSAVELAEFPLASFCADHRVDISSEDEWNALWKRQNRIAPHLRTHFAWQLVPICTAWPAATGNPQHRLHIRRTAPILLLNSLHDPATGYEWATNVADQIDNGRLLTYDGWGHGVVRRSDCTRGAVDRYLLDLTVPRPGTHCPAVPPDTIDAASTAAAPLPW
jgi:pimeloyl-ACP methyl ester carboxylesterase